MAYTYCTIEEIKSLAVPEANIDDEDSAAQLTAFAEAAAAMIDKYTKRPDNYFGTAGETATERRFRGEGQNYLRVGRYVAGSLTFVSPTIAETSYYLHPSNGWPFHADTPPNDQSDYWPENQKFFRSGDLYIVSARWGFAETPSDIKTAAALIAGKIFDLGKGVAGEITPSGFVIERDMPLTARTILNGWKAREFEIS